MTGFALTLLITYILLATGIAVGMSLRCQVLEAELTEANARNWALRRALHAADSERQIVLNGRIWRRYRLDRSPTKLPIHRN